MAAYLTAQKQAAIAAQIRRGIKRDADLLLAETANAIAAHKSTHVTSLGQNISPTYSEAEVQAISDKVDALIVALETAGLMATS